MDQTTKIGPNECPNCPGQNHWPQDCRNTPKQIAERRKAMGRVLAVKSTLDMWKVGADFFSSKYSLAERCKMARDCYEAMNQARSK